MVPENRRRELAHASVDELDYLSPFEVEVSGLLLLRRIGPRQRCGGVVGFEEMKNGRAKSRRPTFEY
jgi:hypothetical protein